MLVVEGVVGKPLNGRPENRVFGFLAGVEFGGGGLKPSTSSFTVLCGCKSECWILKGVVGFNGGGLSSSKSLIVTLSPIFTSPIFKSKRGMFVVGFERGGLVGLVALVVGTVV